MNPEDTTLGEAISEEEFFHYAYRSFINATETLTADPLTQCQWMGDYNVAWEVKHDVSAGQSLLGQGELTPEQEEEISNLVSALQTIPTEILDSGVGRESNLIAMSHPSWHPIRAQAASVLKVLREFSEYNTSVLDRLAQEP